MIQFFACFRVPVGQEDAFLVLWREANARIVTKPGYVSHELHRALTDQAQYAFINHAVWESAEHWRNAHDHEVTALLAQPAWKEFPSTYGLYELAHHGTAAAH